MYQWILFYFAFNTVLLLLLWWAVLPKGMSFVGYFLLMFFLGLPIVVLVLVLFAIALLGGATYNFGETVENWFKKTLS